MFFELLNYFLGMICFAGSVFALIFAGFCFKDKAYILGIIISILCIVLFCFFWIAFFTI